MSITKNKVLKLSLIWTLIFGFSVSNAVGLIDDLREFANTINNNRFLKFVVVPATVFTVAAGVIAAKKINDEMVRARRRQETVNTIVALAVFAFAAISFISEKSTCPNCHKYYWNCTCSPRSKLVHACRLGGVRAVKAVFQDNDLGVNENLLDNGVNYKSLHNVCVYGQDRMFEVVRWLIQDKFANVSELDNNLTARQISLDVDAGNFPATYFQPLNYNNPFVGTAGIVAFLQDMENRQQDLVARVNTLQANLADNLEPDVLQRGAQEIRDRMLDRQVPGYAKQLAMSKLVEMHRNRKGLITMEDMRQFYAHIAFNHSFIRDAQFRPAVEFALSNHDEVQVVGDVERRVSVENNFRDIDGRSIMDAIVAYDGDQNYMGYIFENRPQLFGENNAPENAQENGNNLVIDGLKDGFANGLENLKRKNDKKKYRDLANTSIILGDLKKEIKVPDENGVLKAYTLPQGGELGGLIMGFAGTDDFGNKIYGNLPARENN